MGKQREKIREWRRSIPSFKCETGCHDCCNATPTMTTWEFLRLRRYGIKSMPPPGSPCAFLDLEKGCTIYEERPIICRLYGVVPGVPYGLCKRGISPQKRMNPVKAINILLEWNKMVDL